MEIIGLLKINRARPGATPFPFLVLHAWHHRRAQCIERGKCRATIAHDVRLSGLSICDKAFAVRGRKAADQAGLSASLSAALRKAGQSPLLDRIPDRPRRGQSQRARADADRGHARRVPLAVHRREDPIRPHLMCAERGNPIMARRRQPAAYGRPIVRGAEHQAGKGWPRSECRVPAAQSALTAICPAGPSTTRPTSAA
jgi:hypothetical protein